MRAWLTQSPNARRAPRASPSATLVSSPPPCIPSSPKRSSNTRRTAGTKDDPPVMKTRLIPDRAEHARRPGIAEEREVVPALERAVDPERRRIQLQVRAAVLAPPPERGRDGMPYDPPVEGVPSDGDARRAEDLGPDLRR